MSISSVPCGSSTGFIKGSPLSGKGEYTLSPFPSRRTATWAIASSASSADSLSGSGPEVRLEEMRAIQSAVRTSISSNDVCGPEPVLRAFEQADASRRIVKRGPFLSGSSGELLFAQSTYRICPGCSQCGNEHRDYRRQNQQQGDTEISKWIVCIQNERRILHQLRKRVGGAQRQTEASKQSTSNRFRARP